MEEGLREVKAAGFDLDGTLYSTTFEIDERIRTRIAEKILKKVSSLGSVKRARDYFEGEYRKTGSGSKVLERVGYHDSREVMDECLATADVLDLIERDDELRGILENIHAKYKTYLITSSPRDLALQKLNRIGIDRRLFDTAMYSEMPDVSKSDGSAFEYLVKTVSIPAYQHVYVGDREKSDILPAKRLGMKTVAVWSSIEEADFSIDHIHDIKRLLL